MDGFPWMLCLAWYMVVDRSTLRGAAHNPQADTTKTRYAQAATDAFHAIIAVCGLTAFVIGDRLPPTITWTLRSVFGLLVLVFGISYLIRRYRSIPLGIELDPAWGGSCMVGGILRLRAG